MIRLRSFSIVVVGLLCIAASRQEVYGHYVGTVKAEWLSDGRRMKLLEDFEYIDQRYVIWKAPKDSIVDGASIPQWAWSIIGGPFEGKYRDASVIHDVACDKKDRPWQSVHEAFFDAMMASGVDTVHAKVMYAAVFYRGPRWRFVVPLKSNSKSSKDVAEEKKKIARENGIADNRFLLLPADIAYSPQHQAQASSDAKPQDYSAEMAKGVPFVVEVIPDESILSQADFENLRKMIEHRENLKPGSVTLKEIREYKPAMVN
jgi:hypothetical protein